MSDKFTAYEKKLTELSPGEERLDVLNDYVWELCRIDPKKAFKLAGEAYATASEAAYKKGIGESLRNLASCYWLFSDYVSTYEKCMAAIKVFEEIGDKKGEADTVNILGGVFSNQGDYDNAMQSYSDSAAIRESIGDYGGLVKSLNSMGDLCMKQKDYTNALTHFNRALGINDSTDTFKGIVIYNIAEVYFHINDFDKAELFLEECREMGRQMKFILMEVYGLDLLGQIQVRRKQYVEALHSFKQALEYALETDSKDRIYHGYKRLADTYKLTGDMEKAFENFERFHEVKEEVFNEKTLQQIKDMQFQHETKAIQQKAEIERLKNVELKKAYDEIEEKNEQLEQKNKNITDSIRYAKKIQQAILPSREIIFQTLPECFIYYRPRDVVSGDFYSFTEKNGKFILAAVDCTGHGVPGAFMSMIGTNLLNQIIMERGITRPADILSQLNKEIKKALRQDEEGSETRDGMDIALCTFDIQNKTFEYAGAHNPLLIANGSGMQITNGDRTSIGGRTPDGYVFQNHQFPLKRGATIYLYSDGYQDQFGGANRKKFMKRNFLELLDNIHNEPLKAQKQILHETFENWKGDIRQLDDVLVMGIRF